MCKGRAANTIRPTRQQAPPRRRPEPDGVPGRRCPGAQPAPGGRVRWPQDPPLWPSGGPAARDVLPDRPPAMQAVAGELPGNGPAQGPVLGDKDQGPAAPGGEASSPGPQVPLPQRYAAGTCRLLAFPLPASVPFTAMAKPISQPRWVCALSLSPKPIFISPAARTRTPSAEAPGRGTARKYSNRRPRRTRSWLSRHPTYG